MTRAFSCVMLPLVALSSCIATAQEPIAKKFLGSAPEQITFVGRKSLIEFTGLRISMTSWIISPNVYPGNYADDANSRDRERRTEMFATKKESLRKFSLDFIERTKIVLKPEEGRTDTDIENLQMYEKKLLEESREIRPDFIRRENWKITVRKKGVKGEVVVIPKRVDFSPFDGVAILALPIQDKDVTITVSILATLVENRKTGWVPLYTQMPGAQQPENYSFPVTLSKNPSNFDKFEASKADDVALIDGTEKSDIKRLDVDIQRALGGSILEMKGKFSTESKDLEANFDIGLTGRILLSVKNFHTQSQGIHYEVNQLGTNQMVTGNFGTKWYLPFMVGVTPAGQAGFRSYAEFKAEGAYWVRQDPLTSSANAKKAGTWVTGELGVGPMYLGNGKTAFFAKATGYYFPMKDRTFGNNVNAFEGFIEVGFLYPLGVSDEDLKADKGSWLKLTYANGAERANAFANKSSFAITFVTALKF